MKATGLALLALVLAAGAAFADKATPEQVEMVRLFLKTPTSELPPTAIERFLEIDPAGLPQKLQTPYKAKRLELYTLKQLAAGKKKGIVRTPETDCAIPKEAKSNEANVLVAAGYEEIEEVEEHCVMDKTKCSEREMMCEFSLQILHEKVGKKKETLRRLFLHTNDPLMSVVAGCRGGTGGQTNFFGVGAPLCSH